MRLAKKAVAIALAAVMTLSMLTACAGGGSNGGSAGGSSSGSHTGSNVSGNGSGSENNSGTNGSGNNSGSNENTNTSTPPKEKENAVGKGNFTKNVSWAQSKLSTCYSSQKYTIDAVSYLRFGIKDDGTPDYFDTYVHVTSNGNKTYSTGAFNTDDDPMTYTFSDKSANKQVVVTDLGTDMYQAVREEVYKTSETTATPSQANVKSIWSGTYTYTFNGQKRTYQAERFTIQVDYSSVDMVVCYEGNLPKVVLIYSGNAPYIWMEYKSYSPREEKEKLNFNINTLKQEYLDRGFKDGNATT